MVASIGIDRVPVTILSGAALSGAGLLGLSSLVGILMPAAWTTASITFQASFDGQNYHDVVDNTGAEVTVTGAAGQFVQLSPLSLIGLAALKVRSGTSGSPVDQDADRSLGLIVRPLA